MIPTKRGSNHMARERNGVVEGARDMKQARRPLFLSVLGTDNSFCLRVENSYIKAVKGPFRHDDRILL